MIEIDGNSIADVATSSEQLEKFWNEAQKAFVGTAYQNFEWGDLHVGWRVTISTTIERILRERQDKDDRTIQRGLDLFVSTDERLRRAEERVVQLEQELRLSRARAESAEQLLKKSDRRAIHAATNYPYGLDELFSEPKMELMSSRIRREELQRQARMMLPVEKVVVGAWYLRRAGDAVKVVPKDCRSLTTACTDDFDLGGQFVYGVNSPDDLVARLVAHDDSSAPSEPWTVRP